MNPVSPDRWTVEGVKSWSDTRAAPSKSSWEHTEIEMFDYNQLISWKEQINFSLLS